MTPTTLPTIQAVETIHRAQQLIDSRQITVKAATELNALSEAVLSFTGFYLKQPNPICRPEQRLAFDTLKAMVIQLEKT